MTRKSVDELWSGLEAFLQYGYVQQDSFSDPNDEATDWLAQLYVDSPTHALLYCKRILEAPALHESVKAYALDFLLLSSERNYAYHYLSEEAVHLSIPELEKAFFYFSCDTPYPIPEGLIVKLLARFEVVKCAPDACFYHLHETYNDFVKALSDKLE